MVPQANTPLGCAGMPRGAAITPSGAADMPHGAANTLPGAANTFTFTAFTSFLGVPSPLKLRSECNFRRLWGGGGRKGLKPKLLLGFTTQKRGGEGGVYRESAKVCLFCSESLPVRILISTKWFNCSEKRNNSSMVFK